MDTPDQTPTIKQMVCPVCSMLVTKDDAVASVDHDTHTHYFCSIECKDEFQKDPKKYH